MLVPVTRRLRQSNPATTTVALNQLLMERSKMSLLVDESGVVQDFPLLAAGSFGHTAAEMNGQPFADLVHADDRNAFHRSLLQPKLSLPNAPIRLLHSNRRTPVDMEITMAAEPDGVRIVLADVASWRAVDWAAQVVVVPPAGSLGLYQGAEQPVRALGSPTVTTVTEPPSAEHSLGFVMRLDRQCVLVAANTSWQDLSGALMTPGLGKGIGPSTWMHSFDQELIGRFGQSLPAVRGGASFQSMGRLIDRSGDVRPISVAICSIDRGASGFVLLGFETGPITERVALPTTQLSDRAEVVATASITSEPDHRTQAIIASVLSAARADDDQPNHRIGEPNLADRTAEQTADKDANQTEDHIVAWPVLAHTELAGNAKQLLADHLQALHHDGLDAVVSTALLLVKVELAARSKDDEAYEMGVLERRLRAAIRDHEYADRHDLRGFVVAARGGFGHEDLQALALRLANRLQAPLRGHSATDLVSLTVAAVRSKPGESDQDLIARVQDATTYAVDHKLSVYVALNDLRGRSQPGPKPT